MPNLTEMERRNYEQRLARLEDIALRLSGELFMEESNKNCGAARAAAANGAGWTGWRAWPDTRG